MDVFIRIQRLGKRQVSQNGTSCRGETSMRDMMGPGLCMHILHWRWSVQHPPCLCGQETGRIVEVKTSDVFRGVEEESRGSWR